MKIIKISILIVAIFQSVMSYAADIPKGKYQQGDCIRGADPSYSWDGQFAKVEAYSYISGFIGPNYILYFPNYKANSVIFSPDIEKSTIKVDSVYCQKY